MTRNPAFVALAATILSSGTRFAPEHHAFDAASHHKPDAKPMHQKKTKDRTATKLARKQRMKNA